MMAKHKAVIVAVSEGVEIPEEELESIQTVGDIIEFMKSKGVEG